MSTFSKLFFRKDKKRNYSLPSLKYPLARKVNGNQIYFLKNGKYLLSVVEEKENHLDEVIKKLDTLDPYFHFPYKKLYYDPDTDNLCAYSYPYIGKKPTMTSLLDSIFLTEEERKILENITYGSTSGFMSKITYMLLLYKILVYLNKNGISVKNLEISDIKDEDQNIYFNMMNAIVHLDILKPEEPLEISSIVSLCLQYMDINEKHCGKELENFITNFNSSVEMDENLFNDILIRQIKSTKLFSCGHEVGFDAIRCPLCHAHEILTQEKIKFLDPVYQGKAFTVYVNGKEDEKYYNTFYLLANNPSDLNRDVFLEWLESEEGSFYRLDCYIADVYNSDREIIGIKFRPAIVIQDNLRMVCYFSFEQMLEALFVDKKLEISLLPSILKGFKFNYQNWEKYFENYEDIDENIFMMMFQKEIWLFSNPITLGTKQERKSYNWNKVFLDKIFLFCQQKFHSRVENDEIVSDQSDILMGLNYHFILEYKKFLMQEEYDANLAMSVLKTSISHFRNGLDYDDDYVVDPKEFKTIPENLVNENDSEYEWVKESKYAGDLMSCKKDLADKILMPDKIVYRLFQYNSSGGWGNMVYAGYLIKRVPGISLRAFFEEGRFRAYNNKEILNVLVRIFDYICQYSVYDYFNFLYITEDLKEIYMKYNSNLDEKNEFNLETIVKILEESKIYFSNALEIISEDRLSIQEKRQMLILLSTNFTKYCQTHQMYYEDTYSRCPVCYKYTIFIQAQDIATKGKLILENNFYQIFTMDLHYIKLYKFNEKGELPNGSSINEIETNVYHLLENKKSKNILYIVKDDVSETTIGVMINKVIHAKNLLQFLGSSKVTNLNYLKLIQSILDCYFNEEKKFQCFLELFKQNGNLNGVLEGLAYKKDKIRIIDEEIFGKNSSFSTKKERIQLLSKMISYIVKCNPNFFELSCITLPEESDDEYIDTVLEKVNDLIDNMPDYCKKHHFYYNKKDGMCPLCAKEKQVLIVHSEEDLKQMFGENSNFGGECMIYNFGLTQLAKLYNKPVNRDPERNKVLIIEHLKKLKIRTKLLELSLKLNEITKDELKSKNFEIIFANQLIFAEKDGKRILKGFVQNKVQDCVSMMSFLNNNICEELGYDNIPSMLQLLISYGEAIHYLHESETVKKIVPEGLVLGDISGRNILFSTTEKKIAIIDTDSFGTNEYPCTLYTESYTDPVLYPKYGHNTFESDWYSYAVLCFSMLTKIHPFEGVYRKDPSMKVWDRKLKRISIIGKYKDDITISRDALVDWNWMPKELLQAFVDIFEKGERFSILPLLQEAYCKLTGEKYGGQIKHQDEIEQIEILEPRKSQVEVLLYVEDGEMMTKDNIVVRDNYIFYRHAKGEILLCDKTFQRKFQTNECEVLMQLENIAGKTVDKVVETYIIMDKGVFTIILEGRKYIGYLKEGIPYLLYRITDVTREFKILWDQIYDNYFLFALDGSKSYIVKDKQVIPTHDIYHVDQKTREELLEKIDHITYIGNSLIYPENGWITKFDMQTGNKGRLSCDIATEESFVYAIYDCIIVVNSSGIYQLKNE